MSGSKVVNILRSQPEWSPIPTLDSEGGSAFRVTSCQDGYMSMYVRSCKRRALSAEIKGPCEIRSPAAASPEALLSQPSSFIVSTPEALPREHVVSRLPPAPLVPLLGSQILALGLGGGR